VHFRALNLWAISGWLKAAGNGDGSYGAPNHAPFTWENASRKMEEFQFLALPTQRRQTIPLLSFSQGPSGQKNSEDTEIIWLVVLTILQNISQWEGLSHILWKIKNV
jgi:hypothetical protein